MRLRALTVTNCEKGGALDNVCVCEDAGVMIMEIGNHETEVGSKRERGVVLRRKRTIGHHGRWYGL